MNRLLGWFCIFSVVLGCSQEPARPVDAPEAPSLPRKEGGESTGVEPVPIGSLVAQRVAIEFAIYLFGDEREGLQSRAAEVAGEFAPQLTLTDTPGKKMTLPALYIHQPPISEYSPPDADSIRYSAQGLDKTQLEKTPRAKSVVVLTAFATRDNIDSVHRALLGLAHRLCGEWSGVLWDEDTRQVFSPAAWRAERLSWKEGPPNLSQHVTMHAYRNGPLIRIVTLGMCKFGLPDVVVNDVPSGATRGMGNLINLACQTLFERQELAREGEFEVSIDSIENRAVASSQQTNILESAKRNATLNVVYTTPEEGDADNRLIEIVFGDDEGEAPQVAQDRILGEIYGSSDEVSMVSHDHPDIQAASKRAVASLMNLKPSFTDGPEVNEQLLVKAPFETPTGTNEWMWVEVVSWDGTLIRGILANDPFDVPDLQAGASVEVTEDTLFDYIHRRADGTQVGNETGKLIERLRTKTRTK